MRIANANLPVKATRKEGRTKLLKMKKMAVKLMKMIWQLGRKGGSYAPSS